MYYDYDYDYEDVEDQVDEFADAGYAGGDKGIGTDVTDEDEGAAGDSIEYVDDDNNMT